MINGISSNNFAMQKSQVKKQPSFQGRLEDRHFIKSGSVAGHGQTEQLYRTIPQPATTPKEDKALFKKLGSALQNMYENFKTNETKMVGSMQQVEGPGNQILNEQSIVMDIPIKDKLGKTKEVFRTKLTETMNKDNKISERVLEILEPAKESKINGLKSEVSTLHSYGVMGKMTKGQSKYLNRLDGALVTKNEAAPLLAPLKRVIAREGKVAHLESSLLKNAPKSNNASAQFQKNKSSIVAGLEKAFKVTDKNAQKLEQAFEKKAPSSIQRLKNMGKHIPKNMF